MEGLLKVLEGNLEEEEYIGSSESDSDYHPSKEEDYNDFYEIVDTQDIATIKKKM